MKKTTEAKCTRTMLTVAFHAADPPLIWRFDLERNHSFTLSLQGEEGDWELGVTTPKGDFYPIAHFAERERGEEALAKIEKVLAKANSIGPIFFKLLVLIVFLALTALAGIALFDKSLTGHFPGVSF